MGRAIALVGEEAPGMRLLRSLHSRGCDLRLVLSDGPVGRAAAKLGYEVGPADRVTDPSFASRLADVDLLLNVHSLHLVTPEVLRAPAIGCLNVHPGPLPEYAGLNTPCWAIYDGAEEYGVTLHWMVPQIDAGAIALERRWPLNGDETGLDLWTRCAEESVALASRFLERMSVRDPDVPKRPQDLGRRTYYGAGPPGRGRIDWRADSRQIERLVRACDLGPFPSPWGRPVASFGGGEAVVLDAEILNGCCAAVPGSLDDLGDGWFRVATADAWMRVRMRWSDRPPVRPESAAEPSAFSREAFAESATCGSQ